MLKTGVLIVTGKCKYEMMFTTKVDKPQGLCVIAIAGYSYKGGWPPYVPIDMFLVVYSSQSKFCPIHQAAQAFV
jgi:hypothetical protein